MFYLKNKTSVPMLYCGNKTWVRVQVRMNKIMSALACTRTSTNNLLTR